MSPAADTRDQILDVAEALLRERGFSAFSYQDIADAVGIRKASIYYHFPSKEGLGVALVERFQARLKALGLGLAKESPVARLELYFCNSREVLEEGDKICAFGMLSAEVRAFPPEMRAVVEEMMRRQLWWLERALQEGREAGFFNTGAPVEEQAALVSAALLGALQVARAVGETAAFDGVEARLREEIFTDAGRKELAALRPRLERFTVRNPSLHGPSLDPVSRE